MPLWADKEMRELRAHNAELLTIIQKHKAELDKVVKERDGLETIHAELLTALIKQRDKLRTALDDLVELVREEHHGWPEFLLAEAAIANDEERG